MPVLAPTSGTSTIGAPITFLINDLINEVLIRTENRTTDTNRAAVWLRDALLEISGSPDYRDDFVELELIGPTLKLTPGTQEYAETSFLPFSTVASLIDDILIWVDYPSNTTRRKLDVSHYQKTDKFTPILSLPTEWYRYAGNIGFNPVPNLAYQVQARLVQTHPINDANIAQTKILLPRDWNEVLVMAAVIRGFVELMEYEKAEKVRRELYGDPDNKAQPGIIYHVKRKRRKEQ